MLINLNWGAEKRLNKKNDQIPISGFNEARDGFIAHFAKENLIGKTVLELGCGNGERTELIYNISQMIGIDIVTRVSKERRKKFIFILADATRLPFRDNIFDAVVSFDVIEHVEEDKIFVDEAIRVSKNSGRVIIGTPNRLRLSNRLRILAGKKLVYPCAMGPGVIHLREYTSGELLSLMQNAGLTGECRFIWIGILNKFGIGLRRFPEFLNSFVQYLLFLGRKPIFTQKDYRNNNGHDDIDRESN